MTSKIKIIPAATVTGCRADCPMTRHYPPGKDGETLGCVYAYGTLYGMLPKEGFASWCPLKDRDCRIADAMILCVNVTKVTIVTGRGADKVGLHTTENSPSPGMSEEQLMMSFTVTAGDGFRYVTEVLRIDNEYVEIIDA